MTRAYPQSGQVDAPVYGVGAGTYNGGVDYGSLVTLSLGWYDVAANCRPAAAQWFKFEVTGITGYDTNGVAYTGTVPAQTNVYLYAGSAPLYVGGSLVAVADFKDFDYYGNYPLATWTATHRLVRYDVQFTITYSADALNPLPNLEKCGPYTLPVTATPFAATPNNYLAGDLTHIV